jgi:type I restriction enzyme, S subunit
MYPSKKLSEILLVIRNWKSCKQTSDSIGDKITRIETISQWNINSDKVWYFELTPEEKEKYSIEKWDILFSHINSVEHIWKVAIAKQKYDNLFHGMNLLLLRADKNIINPEFLYIVLFTYFKKGYWRAICKKAINQASLNQKNLNELEIPLPSLSTQSRIVARLDTAFASIDEQISLLRANIADVDNMRKSILIDIFDKSEHTKPKLMDITSVLGDGLHGTPKYDENWEYYFINWNNLNNGSILIKADTKRVSIDEYEKYKKPLNDRTILVSINGTIWNVAFYDNEKVVLGKSACYFNIQDNVDKYFIKYAFMSSYFMNYANKELTGTTIKNVSLKTMRNFPIPLPPLPRQHEIVAHLDEVFETTQTLRSEYEAQIRDLETLKQSLLEEAFAGRLVEDKE